MSIFVNRTINLKKIKAIGFDMDYTIVRYHTEEFERLTHKSIIESLIESKNYPTSISKLSFDFKRAIQGLVLDKKRGNILKVSRFGKVKFCTHGTHTIPFKEQERIYRNRVIDLNDSHFQILDTSFSISNGVLYGQLVDLKESGENLPSFEEIADDVREILDLVHKNGALKNEVRKNIEKYIIQEPEMVERLELYKEFGKKLLIITNSDFNYTKLLLDHTINPFLKNHQSWMELFQITITLSKKPEFFTANNHFLRVAPKTALMTNTEEVIESGIFQSGSAKKLQADLGLEGDEILYLGDHIYGDVVTLKKTFNWRTALVVDQLEVDILALKKSNHLQNQIDELMVKKEQQEQALNKLYSPNRSKDEAGKKEINSLYTTIDKLDSKISILLEEHKNNFNPYWGDLMRAGQEESRYADQVEKYACVYMAKVSDLLSYSPRTYFRPRKRVLPHELF